MRRATSVMTTTSEVLRATSASRCASSLMRCASVSAWRRTWRCCHISAASRLAASAPEANTPSGTQVNATVSKAAVLRTCSSSLRPGA